MAAKLAGCEVARVEVGKDGRIIVILANANGQPSNKAGCSARNEWDEVLK